MTFYGEAMTLEEVKALTPSSEYRILVLNMEGNRWKRVVRTIFGEFMPMSNGDLAVLPNKERIA